MHVCKKERKYTWQKNARMKKKYRVAGMTASIHGKKPHVYRVIILKQMADHRVSRDNVNFCLKNFEFALLMNICMYAHKYSRPHHSWFILLSDNNNNIIRRIMLLAHRLSSCKLHSCARYLDMYIIMYSACSSKQLSKKCVCAICTSASEWVCISDTSD